MYILGLNAYHPDSSACLVRDGKLIAAAEEERFCGIKHWSGFPTQAICYCLREAGLELGEVNYVAVNKDPRAHLFQKLLFVGTHNPSFRLLMDRATNASHVFRIKDALMSKIGVSGKAFCAKMMSVEHHRAHLASAFLVSPFDESVIVSIDGFGDFTSCMVATGRGNRINVLYEVNYPHSLGIFYTAFTQFLGFDKFGDEYKVMGLAAYGNPNYVKEMEDIIILKPKGKYELDLDYFSFYKNGIAMEWNDTAPTLSKVYSKKFEDKFSNASIHNGTLSQYHYDLSASLQKVYENALFHVLNYAFKRTGISHLCLSGGCALNSSANGKIARRTKFTKVYIQPASSDAGGSLGAAYYLYNHILGKERTFVMKHAYWGPQYNDAEIETAMKALKEGAAENRYEVEKTDDTDTLCTKTAKLIAEGKIVGWFQGRMEWGPRALGNRSILADPRREEMKDILNERIKKREWFRPFAPSILLERVNEYFETDCSDPFMLKVCPIKEDKKAHIPAVTHIVGTGRLQTVSKDENPVYWKLINEFDKLTGIPILLNTSFNENEPIVCTPQKALECFLRTRMDVLVLARYVLVKKRGTGK